MNGAWWDNIIIPSDDQNAMNVSFGKHGKEEGFSDRTIETLMEIFLFEGKREAHLISEE